MGMTMAEGRQTQEPGFPVYNALVEGGTLECGSRDEEEPSSGSIST